MKAKVLLAVAVSAALGACSLGQSDALDEARSAYAAENYIGARANVQEILQADARDPVALEMLARIQLAMGQGGEVPATLDRLEALNALPADAPLLRAEALLQLGEIARAREVLQGWQNAESWRLRALAAALDNTHEAVLAAFAAGREAEGEKRKLFAAEATYHLDRGDAQAARYAVGQIQQLAPESIETLFVSARYARMVGRHQLAARAYMAILEHAPQDRPAMIGAIEELRRIGRFDLARDIVSRGGAAYPGDIEFVHHTALFRADASDWQGVREILQQREDAVAGFTPSRLLYGQALLQLGQLEQARAQVAPLYRQNPGNREFARTYAQILLASREFAEARQVIGPFASAPDADELDRQIADLAARG